eukprot:CAMPEP_0179337372 /NCGR_PEP_ID=MMETSP0797-20121207/67582_1 /TAXON_ID=47934 /ORGANISM="Dinophysis acuminata, Strain DAEP01" /LENGTH=36 /DNA_ID= /DNA_START= /DNA_END= /DNA_ORIENTATION=
MHEASQCTSAASGAQFTKTTARSLPAFPDSLLAQIC